MNRRLVWIFTIALFIRALYAFFVFKINPDGVFVFDSWGYLNIGYNLYHFQEFSQYTDGSFIPDSTRTPAYPLFISFFHLFSLNEWWIIATQVFMSATIPIIAYKIGIELNLPVLGASIVALILAIEPSAIFFSSVILSETLFCLLLLCTVLFSLKEKYLSAGIFLSLSIICRPIAVYLPILFGVMLLLKKDFNWQARLRPLAIFLIPIILGVGGWSLRNKKVFGEFFVSSIGEVNLLFHTSVNIKSKQTGESAKAIEREYRNKLLGDLDFNAPSSIPLFRERAKAEFVAQVSTNPGIFLRIYFRSMVMFFTKPMRSYFDEQFQLGKVGSISGVLNQTPSLKTIMQNSSFFALCMVGIQGLLLGLTFLLVIGSLFGNGLTKSSFLLLVGLILYFAAISALSEVDARFRLPVFPFMLILGFSSDLYKKLAS